MPPFAKLAYYFFKCFYLFSRERVHASEGAGEGETQRGRERIGSRLWAISTDPDTGLEPVSHEIMTLVEIKSQMLNQLSHPDALPN